MVIKAKKIICALIRRTHSPSEHMLTLQVEDRQFTTFLLSTQGQVRPSGGVSTITLVTQPSTTSLQHSVHSTTNALDKGLILRG